MRETTVKSFGQVILSGIGWLAQEKARERQNIFEEQKAQNEFKRNVQMAGLEAGLDVAKNIVGTASRVMEDKARTKYDLENHKMSIQKESEEEQIYERKIKFEKEIEQLEKDKDLQRRKDVLESIQRYQIEVTKAVNESMLILATMPVELQRKADAMFSEEQEKCYRFLGQWQSETFDKIAKINELFSNNERVKMRLENAIMDEMDEIAQMTAETVQSMAQNIERIRNNAVMLSQKGEQMVEIHTQSAQVGERSRYLLEE